MLSIRVNFVLLCVLAEVGRNEGEKGRGKWGECEGGGATPGCNLLQMRQDVKPSPIGAD